MAAATSSLSSTPSLSHRVANSSSRTLPGSPTGCLSPVSTSASSVTTFPTFNTIALQEIQNHKGAESSWVIYDGKVYDITAYVKSGSHPGGNSVLWEFLGDDMTEAFKDIGHSSSAVRLLDSFLLGYVEGSNPSSEFRESRIHEPHIHDDRDHIIGKVNLRKPLVQQIYLLSKEEYIDLAGEYFCSTAVCDFFSSPFLEILTRTAWWIIPSLWLPVAFLLFLQTKGLFNLSLQTSLSCFVFGVFCWTLAEYWIHRSAFHFDETLLPDSRIVRVIHFLGHGVHHLLPMDPMRLVLPPVLLIILMAPFYLVLSSLFPLWLVRAVWPGVLVGYVCYDMIHYAEHHFPIEHIRFLQFMKGYHMKHHFKDPLKAFGVSTPIWDFVFGTMS